MAVKFTFEGMNEFRQALRSLPDDLQREAAAVVNATAQSFSQELRANYPEVTGNLKRGVRVSSEGGSLGVRATVRSAAPHAHLFEEGTATRTTRSGANRGVMPRGREDQRMIPRAIRFRQRMTLQLIAIVQKAGLLVNAA